MELGYTLQFFIVAIVFTVLGWIFGCQWMSRNMAQIAVEKLIDDGYIKTKLDENGQIEIIRWYEDHDQIDDEAFAKLLEKLKTLGEDNEQDK